MAEFTNIVTLVTGTILGENRAHTVRGRGAARTRRRRRRRGRRAGMGHRRPPHRPGWPRARPGKLAALQRRLPGRAGSSRATWAPQAPDPDPGLSIKGVRVGVMGWVHDDVGFQLGDKLLGFLRDSVPADTNTRYNVLGDALLEVGFAPTVAYAGRIAGDSTTGLYVGGAFHYYVGLAYVRVNGDGGFTTGDSIFSGPSPVKPDARGLTQYSKFGNSFGHGGGGQRVGVIVLRGGVARDQRKRIELGWGGGLRFGGLGLDVGFWTHTNSLSNQRGITMATSLSIY